MENLLWIFSFGTGIVFGGLVWKSIVYMLMGRKDPSKALPEQGADFGNNRRHYSLFFVDVFLDDCIGSLVIAFVERRRFHINQNESVFDLTTASNDIFTLSKDYILSINLNFKG
jgi:hypothetical protein